MSRAQNLPKDSEWQPGPAKKKFQAIAVHIFIMFTIRRLYLTATTTTKRTNVIVSPGARAPSSSRTPGYRRSPNSSVASNMANTATAATSTSTTHRRRLERVAVVSMLVLAWLWVMVFVGIVLYHGYQSRRTAHDHHHHHSKNQGSDDPTTSINSNNNVPDPRTALSQAVAKSSPHDTTAASSEEFLLQPYTSPLLIFTCRRAQYLQETLDKVLEYIPSDCSMGCPVILSQDGTDPDVAAVISAMEPKFTAKLVPPSTHTPLFLHWTHTSALRKGRNFNAYQALSQHYGWALRKLFATTTTKTKEPSQELSFQRVIILEEDIRIAPDFFYYFRKLTPILEQQQQSPANTLLAISAFNDNGFTGHVQDATRVLRSDFFPGLGWMLTRNVYTALPQWPLGYWDDWLRDPAQRQNRHVLRPEVSRTFHFGVADGASGNQFGKAFLSRVELYDTGHEVVDWDTVDVSYVASAEAFAEYYQELMDTAVLQQNITAALEAVKTTNVKVQYHSWKEFQTMARSLGLMDDEKAGIPRTGYEGVVETRPHGENLLFLYSDTLTSTK